MHYNVLILLKTPQLSGLNTIEHLWIELKDQLENCNIKNKESGKKKVVEAWETIIEMMLWRLQAVIDTHGNAIKY